MTTVGIGRGASERESAPSSLGQEWKAFWGHRNPQVMAAVLVPVVAIRVALGGWTWWDLAVVGGFIALEPFIEWMIHVFVLHWRPKNLFGKKIDPLVSRKHRAHHKDPRKTEWIFVPFPVLVQVIPVSIVLYLLIMPTARLAVTTMMTGLSILFVYEWTHYLIHSRYTPKSRIYRFIWRAHRLHHFKNEKYWFGVTMHAGDFVLGTFPDKDEVETSPTCKTLGIAEKV